MQNNATGLRTAQHGHDQDDCDDGSFHGLAAHQCTSTYVNHLVKDAKGLIKVSYSLQSRALKLSVALYIHLGPSSSAATCDQRESRL
jgi:hypothetical protein